MGGAYALIAIYAGSKLLDEDGDVHRTLNLGADLSRHRCRLFGHTQSFYVCVSCALDRIYCISALSTSFLWFLFSALVLTCR
jgi:hypothetical protein